MPLYLHRDYLHTEQCKCKCHGWSWLNIILDIIDIIIVSLFIYFDTIKIKQHARKVMTFSKKVKFLNILKDAGNIYLDFLVIWSSLFDLMAESED